jgi:hypothetical protein
MREVGKKYAPPNQDEIVADLKIGVKRCPTRVSHIVSKSYKEAKGNKCQ